MNQNLNISTTKLSPPRFLKLLLNQKKKKKFLTLAHSYFLSVQKKTRGITATADWFHEKRKRKRKKKHKKENTKKVTRVPSCKIERGWRKKGGGASKRAFLSSSTSIKTTRFSLPKNPDPEIRVCRRVKMKKSINDGTAFSGSSFPLFILSRIGGLEYKEDRCLEGATIFEGEKEETREERKQKEKGGGGETDTGRRRREILGWMKRWGEKRSKVRRRADEEEERERSRRWKWKIVSSQK